MIAHHSMQRAGIRVLAARMLQKPAARYDFEREAAELGLSYSRFRRIFSEELDCPPARYLTRARMRHAALELKRCEDSLAAVAHRIGMTDPYHFSRLFKRHMGVPPDNFRRRQKHRFRHRKDTHAPR